MQLLNRIAQFFSIDSELENFDIVDEEIRKGSIFRGTNLWILFFAIVVASVGLNMNSTAVIIGAMLISPLMGPINGMGYGIATYNFSLFRQAASNFSFAVFVSLLASTAYFSISPISTAHSELLARTTPTIYDVIIALFGGLAGIVAISSRQKGNVIPGVAIATALMPPLCTAGYGLATAQIGYFLGALFLFTINTVFIAIASVVASQFFNFPIRSSIAPAQKRRINHIISLITALVLVPSVYFGYLLVLNERFSDNANRFITDVSLLEDHYLLRSDVDIQDKKVTLTYAGNHFTAAQLSRIKLMALNFKIDSSAVVVRQGLAFDRLDRSSEVLSLRARIGELIGSLKSKDRSIDSLITEKRSGGALLREASAFFPQISSCAFARTMVFSDSLNKPSEVALVVFSVGKKPLSKIDKDRLLTWTKARLRSDNVMVVYR